MQPPASPSVPPPAYPPQDPCAEAVDIWAREGATTPEEADGAATPEEACNEWAAAEWGALEGTRSLERACHTSFALSSCAATCCARASVAPPRVLWRSGTPDAPFTRPFTLSAHAGKLWIAPVVGLEIDTVRQAHPPGAAAVDIGAVQWEELKLKGANWAGIQASGCVHELYKYPVSEYLAYLRRERFNAVRLPLSAALLNMAASADGYVLSNICGEYAGWELLGALDDLIRRLAAAGLFVMLDMHTLDYPEGNNGLWCTGEAPGSNHCGRVSERPIYRSWRLLAQRYCSFPNVVLADVFNEPHDASWDAWRDFVQRIARDAIHAWCDRWIVVAEGIGGASPCNDCWWGENVIRQSGRPITPDYPTDYNC